MEKQAPGAQQRSYTEEYKRQVVDLVVGTGRTAVAAVAIGSGPQPTARISPIASVVTPIALFLPRTSAKASDAGGCDSGRSPRSSRRCSRGR